MSAIYQITRKNIVHNILRRIEKAATTKKRGEVKSLRRERANDNTLKCASMCVNCCNFSPESPSLHARVNYAGTFCDAFSKRRALCPLRYFVSDSRSHFGDEKNCEHHKNYALMACTFSPLEHVTTGNGNGLPG